MPPGVQYVGRPTKFGNPYAEHVYGLDLCLRLFENTAQGIWDSSVVPDMPFRDKMIGMIYKDHQYWLKRIEGNPIEVIRAELRGKDLACFCPLDRRCHVTTLLRIANE